MTLTPPPPTTQKIVLLSDTHGWLDPALAHWCADASLILHAGDVGSEALLGTLRGWAPTVAVRGNVDGGAWARELPLSVTVEVAGQRIALLHIAGSPRRPQRAALDLLAREQPDILLVGHSHIAVVQRAHGTLWINPGAAGRQGFHKERTIMLLHLDAAGQAEPALDLVRLGRR